MFIADAHCDALLRMAQGTAPVVSLQSLKEGGVGLQNFALFAPAHYSIQQQKELIMKEIQLFQEQILPLTSNGENALEPLLSLEGAAMIGADINSWDHLLESGVQMAALTWNERNHLAAGSSQSNRCGLTHEGRQVIDWMNENHVVLDAAHLNERSFWEALELADQVAVSHTNVQKLHDHPRNLSDEQIQAVRQKQGFIGLTFYPLFINGTTTANFSELGWQIDHLCRLGAGDMIGFGSDFDGIDETVTGLDSPETFPKFIEWLLQRFDENTVKGIAGRNFQSFWNNRSFDD